MPLTWPVLNHHGLCAIELVGVAVEVSKWVWCCFRGAVSAVTTYMCDVATRFRAHTCCGYGDGTRSAAGLQGRRWYTRHRPRTHKTSQQSDLCISSVRCSVQLVCVVNLYTFLTCISSTWTNVSCYNNNNNNNVLHTSEWLQSITASP